MKIFNLLTGSLSLLVILSCSGNKESGDILKEANETHLEAVGIYDEAHALYGKLKESAGESRDSLLTVRLDSVHDLLHTWKDGLYEVPGFEHSHDHEGDSHEHHHKPAPSMTDQSMLEYQRNAREAIEDLRDELEKWIEK